MGQKVNPISLRLEKTNRHFDSCWYGDYNYTDLLLQDLKIKNYFKTVLNQISYPEGRLLIESLPKKTNVNLFYLNPTNSRRKKNLRFQLQNFKENKNRYKDKTKTLADKNKNSFFSFPEQKYWTDKSSSAFTLAQQTIEEIQPFENNERYLKVLQPKTPFYSLSNLFLQKKVDAKKSEIEDKYGKEFLTKTKDYLYFPSKTIKQVETVDFQEKPSLNWYITKSLSINFVDLFNPFLKYISYKENMEDNVNGKLLLFVLKVNNSMLKTSIEKKWTVERFFIRYLLAQFYCKFLQNKCLYNQETIHTLYKFLIFFSFNFFLRKKTSNKKKDKIQTKKEDSTQTNSQRIADFRGKGSQKENTERTKNHKHFRSGLYSSNRVYKSHLESFLSKEYNTFFNLNFFRSLTEKQTAFFLVQEIIYYLERKMPFRRIKTQILREIPHYKRIKGIRITCSGRVGGRSKKAQRSKTQSVKIGQTSLGVFSSKIDFASKSALTRFGLIGVKVWVCYQ